MMKISVVIIDVTAVFLCCLLSIRTVLLSLGKLDHTHAGCGAVTLSVNVRRHNPRVLTIDFTSAGSCRTQTTAALSMVAYTVDWTPAG